MYHLKHHVTKMNDTICIIQSKTKYRSKRYIVMQYRALAINAGYTYQLLGLQLLH